MVRDRHDDRDRQRGQHQAEAFLEHRLRQEQAAVVEKSAARQQQAVAHLRQHLEHGVVPEQQLQQQRQVADHFDVDRGEPRHQPVGGQPRDADDEAEHCGKHDAQRRNHQRVEQPNPEGAAVGGRGAVVDQVLADIEAGGVVPEAETRGDLGARQVFDRVARRCPNQECDRSQQHGLIDEAADPRIVDQRSPGRSFGLSGVGNAHAARPSRRRTAPASLNSLAERSKRSADRRRVLQPALVPERIDAAADLQREPWPTLRSNASP